MGIYLSNHDRDCLTNLRFADDVMFCSQHPKDRFGNMMCEFKESNRKSGTHDSPKQDEDSQQPEHRQLEHKQLEVDDIEHRSIEKK